MVEVRWTPQAMADLGAIEDYFLEVAPSYAEVIVDGLLHSTRRLETYPRSGRIVPEIDDDAMREVIYRDYRVIYMCDMQARRVDVLSVLHASRQFKR